ncbi:two-component sensor histidine kinase BarA [Pseudaeromonas sharmana]|uniref:histidine kinase n=1 Tax=Pseudaeromonas sharmana TaxID=328412 RepID=A0ABV8CMY5_9GAMM
MTKYGLRGRVLAFTVLPTLIIGCLLAGYFTFHRYQQLEEYIIEQGISVIEPLAIASEYGMKQNNRELLKRLLGLTHRKNSSFIKSIAVFDLHNQLFVTSNFHRELHRLRLPGSSRIPDLTSIEYQGDDIILRTPILEEVSLTESSLLERQAQPVVGYIAIQMNTDHALIIQYRDTAVAVLIVLAGLILSLYFGLNLVSVVIDPINRMVRAVYQIREGRLDTRVRGQMRGELDMLKNGINAMAKAIAEYHNEMQMNIDQATSDLRETLEQIEIQNVELDMAKKRAQEAARVKSEFLANMSHELRTPLNGVIGFAKQLMKTPLVSNQLDYLGTIEKSAKNLLNIINDILDFSKLEAGKLTLEQIPFSLRDVINETMTLLAPSAHDKGLELSLRVDASVPDLLTGDPLRLQQILTNLAGNAIKFTEQGNVDIHISADNSPNTERVNLAIRIRDTGIGMSQQQQYQLFQPFNQGDSSISRRYGGTGLGLVITQKLVQQMGGNIQVESHLEQGSLFILTLPMQPASQQAEEHPQLKVLTDEPVLLIEADAWARQACLSQLEEWKMRVFAIAQVEESERLNQLHFTTLLMGLPAKPDLTALPAQLEQIRGHYDRLVFLLNSHDPQLQAQLLALGASHCLSKPVPHSKLLAALLSSHSYTPTQQQPAPRPQRLPLNVLAVDDNPANLKLITAMLDDLVQEVHSCQNGRQAVELAQRMEFDLIFMDIQMPVLDGISATQAIRQEGCNQHTPIIAVTAHAIPGERERLMAQGMDEYLAKPIDEQQLDQLLRELGLPPSDGKPRKPRPEPGLLCPPMIADARADAPNQVAIASAHTEQLRDAELALRQAAGKPELAQEMLQMLLDGLPEIESLLAHAASQPSEDMVTAIHRLAGSAAYCGLPGLQSHCRQLEQALRAGIPCADLEPELLELQDLLQRLRAENGIASA